MKKFTSFLLLLMAVTLIAASCKSKTPVTETPDTVPPVIVTPDPIPQPPVPVAPEPLPTPSVVEQLIAQYKQGEVEQCLYRTATVYKCSRNAPDAGSEFYSASGKKLGGCYYFSGAVDMICKESSECKTIYRVAKNIWGKPEVVWSGGQ